MLSHAGLMLLLPLLVAANQYDRRLTANDIRDTMKVWEKLVALPNAALEIATTTMGAMKKFSGLPSYNYGAGYVSARLPYLFPGVLLLMEKRLQDTGEFKVQLLRPNNGIPPRPEMELDVPAIIKFVQKKLGSKVTRGEKKAFSKVLAFIRDYMMYGMEYPTEELGERIL